VTIFGPLGPILLPLVLFFGICDSIGHYIVITKMFNQAITVTQNE
jgi:hypothetical protein